MLTTDIVMTLDKMGRQFVVSRKKNTHRYRQHTFHNEYIIVKQRIIVNIVTEV